MQASPVNINERLYSKNAYAPQSMKHRGLWKTEDAEKIYDIILETYELY